ncbi:MAG: 23S rRNA (guanosine(2251)-2'-O)-methyltransferase RlmB [Anaeroplasma sp.]
MIKLYGKNCIYEAVKANSKLTEVFLADFILKKDRNIIDILNKKKYRYTILSKDKMDKEFTQSNQGYAAYRENYDIYDETYLDTLDSSINRVLLLDGIQDPQNLGAILRSVDAFGYDLVILPKNRSCAINETVAHVSTGAIEYTKILYVNSLLNAVNKLKIKGFWVCGTDAKGNTELDKIDRLLKLAIIIGSEGFGMSKTLVNASDYLIKIPMVGHVNSLNASVSTAIVLQHLMKC